MQISKSSKMSSIQVFGSDKRTYPLKTLFCLGAFLLISACSNTTASSKNNAETVFHSQFDQFNPGALVDEDMRKAYPNLAETRMYDRATVVNEDGKNIIAVDYPKGSYGSRKGGSQFLIDLPPQTHYTLDYSLKFDEGFDFRLGGKLPGLTSGGAKWTGGNRPLNGEGFSARLMWRKEGAAELYLYYLDMTGKWGDSVRFTDYNFETGKWYNIRQEITLNDPDKSNAELYIWINDELVLEKRNFRLRKDHDLKIDSLYFSTFHGGGSAKWGPHVDSRAFYGDFIVK